MTQDEEEILEFYRSGSSITDLAYSYGYSVYMIKKFLANEPAIQPLGYIWRSLFPSGKGP
jgi:hypothetical protein